MGLRILLGLIGSASVLGTIMACQPGRTAYNYIFIDSPQFKIDEYGRWAQEHDQIYISSHEDMPIKYTAVRDEYVVRASLDLESSIPSIVYTATTPDGSALLLGGRVFDDCFGHFHDRKNREVGFESPLAALTYTWAARGSEECWNKDDPVNTEFYVELRIQDQNNVILGEEAVTFSAKTNGHYYPYDSY